MSRIELDVAGVEEVKRKLRLLPKELEAASRRAIPRAGQRMRAVAKRELRSRGVGATTIKRRLRGQKARVWLGTDPVTATLRLRGGELAEGEFVLPIKGLSRQDRPIFRREGKKLIPVEFSMSKISGPIINTVGEEGLDRFAESLEQHAEQVLIKTVS